MTFSTSVHEELKYGIEIRVDYRLVNANRMIERTVYGEVSDGIRGITDYQSIKTETVAASEVPPEVKGDLLDEALDKKEEAQETVEQVRETLENE